MNYLSKNEDILIEVVEDFNKRNETYISYMRNQYNALEKYVVAYCNDNNKYLLGVGGKETGINYKFRKVLSEVISLKREMVTFLNSRGVNTLAHFTPLIFDDNSGSTEKHEAFIASYQEYKQNPYDYRLQRAAVWNLCGLLYLVRCNAAHTGKTNRGPNRAKIDRDTSIAKIVTEINRNIFNILMDHPERKLACYGTLVDSCYISGMQSENGKVSGYIDYDTDGIAYFTYESNTGTVDVKLYSCTHAIDFKEMDSYEGESYERICIPIDCAGNIQIANIYERKYLYE